MEIPVSFAFSAWFSSFIPLPDVQGKTVIPMGANTTQKYFSNRIDSTPSEPPLTIRVRGVPEVTGNKILADWAVYSIYSDTFWIDALASIYRVTNGVFSLIRESVVVGGDSSFIELANDGSIPVLPGDMIIVRKQTLYPGIHNLHTSKHYSDSSIPLLRWVFLGNWAGDDPDALGQWNQDSIGYYFTYDIKTTTTSVRRLVLAKTGGTGQSYYKILKSGVTYRLELKIWADEVKTVPMLYGLLQNDHTITKINGISTNNKFPITINIPTTETTISIEFIVDSVGTGTGAQQLLIDLNHIGVYHVRSFKIYELGTPFGRLTPDEYERYSKSNLDHIRDHGIIKTNSAGEAYTLRKVLVDMIHDSLSNTVALGIPNFWLQPELYTINEAEALVEYLCGTSGEWANLRVSLGRLEPWTDDLHIFFEISNETWNTTVGFYNFPKMVDAVTDKDYSTAAVYGMFFQFYINQMKKSPWFLSVNFTFIAGGRFNSHYGDIAAEYSPDTTVVSRAPYVRGWEVGSEGVTESPRSYFETLFWPGTVTPERLEDSEIWLTKAIKSGANPKLKAGTYEDAISYSVLPPNIPDEEKRFSKTKAAATCWLDKVAFQSTKYNIQSEFTMGMSDTWASHNLKSGLPYPYHQWSIIFNLYCHGKMQELKSLGVPLRDVSVAGVQYSKIPEVACYIVNTQSGWTVIIINRNIAYSHISAENDLYNPLDNGSREFTFTVPEQSLHLIKFTMSGEYDQQNLDDGVDNFFNIETVAQDMSVSNGTVTDTIQAGSAAVYVFTQSHIEV